MELSRLAGNAPLKALLGAQGAGRGLSHAYIISGPPGSGRRTLAALLARALVCGGEEGAAPCGRCPHCRKAEAGIHPDIICLGQERDIRVDEVRALRRDACVRPNEARRKVYLLFGADRMNPSAQNALLKLLEEGPAYAAFLLLAEQAGGLLQTVRSRCVELALAPVSCDEALDWLRRRFPGREEADLARAAAGCEGILGRAVQQLEGDGSGGPARQLALQYCALLPACRELALVEFSIALEKCTREELADFYDACAQLLRDGLALQCAAPVAAEGEALAAARALARGLGRDKLLALSALVREGRAACGVNIGAGHSAGWLAAGTAELLQ